MASTKTTCFAVLGAGSWGTALAILLARNGHPTWLWGHNARHIERLLANRCNRRYLPDVVFPEVLRPTSTLREAVSDVNDVLVVVPSHGFREVLEKLQPFRREDTRIAWASKGFESGTGELFHEVVIDVFGENLTYAVVSGPTFAKEVAASLPTAVTVASDNIEFATYLAACFHNENFRVYTSEDVVGVEVGGAIKNVFAIAAGISDGLGFGANARAALITRGVAEMTRLGVALGGQRETFMGLAGVGDLLMTCTDDQSRNRRFGLALGRGQSVKDALAGIDQVVEGLQTAREVYARARAMAIDMPIVEQVYKVLYEDCAPRVAVHHLLQREQKPETI